MPNKAEIASLSTLKRKKKKKTPKKCVRDELFITALIFFFHSTSSDYTYCNLYVCESVDGSFPVLFSKIYRSTCKWQEKLCKCGHVRTRGVFIVLT